MQRLAVSPPRLTHRPPRPPALPCPSQTSYDWSQLTTVAWNEDPALLCTAHAAGARVVLDGRFDPAAVLGTAEHRSAWVAAQLGKALRLHLDGINFDLVGAASSGLGLVGGVHQCASVLMHTCLLAQASNKQASKQASKQVCISSVEWVPFGGGCGRCPALADAPCFSLRLHTMPRVCWHRLACLLLQEEPIPLGDPLGCNYTLLVAEAAAAFHAAIPGSQVQEGSVMARAEARLC